MLISYNWLKSYLPQIPDENEITDLITFHICEIESVEKLSSGDTIFDLKVLPDRAHDLLSHQGVAREIAGLLGIEFKLPEYKIPETKKTDLKIDIETDGCRRYMGRIVRNIKIGESPEWMVKHLESIGARSINNIVDATNIVMFDCGQPIHAFDLAQLSTEAITIRNAKEGEKIELVGQDKIIATLKETDMMITDKVKNLAIAGVKGGLSSGISNETKDILIEVANFYPVSVRKTARRLGIQTDASKRYENDLSPSLCSFAMSEISALILEMCPDAKFEEVADVYPNEQTVRKVSFDSTYISKMLGLNIKNEEIKKILENFNYEFENVGNGWTIIVPLMRLDIVGPHDLVEEIGRAYGYDKIIPILPEEKYLGKDNPTWVKICLAKQKLIADGYREVMTYVFRDKGEVEVLASASDKNFLRKNLSDGVKESILLNQKNLPLFDQDEVKVFEIGTIFKKHGEEINVAYGDKKDVKEMTLNEFNKEEFSSEVVLGENSSPLSVEENCYHQTFKPWSVYPFITRDIAVWVEEGTMPEKLVRIYKEFGTELLIKEPKLFDSFTKDGKTSYAYRLVFQANDRTLTDEEINQIMAKITQKIVSSGWQVR